MPKNKKQKVDMVKFNKEFKNMSVKDKTSYFVRIFISNYLIDY